MPLIWPSLSFVDSRLKVVLGAGFLSCFLLAQCAWVGTNNEAEKNDQSAPNHPHHSRVLLLSTADTIPGASVWAVCLRGDGSIWARRIGVNARVIVQDVRLSVSYLEESCKSNNH